MTYKNTSKNRGVSEHAVDVAFRRACEKAGAVTFKNHPMTNAGIPDRIVHHEGKTFYVELKCTGERASIIQRYMHVNLKAAGIETFVLDKKIKTLDELYDVCYTEYQGEYYSRNPFIEKNLEL